MGVALEDYRYTDATWGCRGGHAMQMTFDNGFVIQLGDKIGYTAAHKNLKSKRVMGASTANLGPKDVR